jgi:hypothetical protein
MPFLKIKNEKLRMKNGDILSFFELRHKDTVYFIIKTKRQV